MFLREGEAGQALTWERSIEGLAEALKDPPPPPRASATPRGGGNLDRGVSLGRRARV